MPADESFSERVLEFVVEDISGAVYKTYQVQSNL